jgi:ABC-type multidrug transport system ATPase subunit
MNFVMGVCDHVLVLDFGKLIASGSPQQIRSDPAVIAAYLGDEVTEADLVDAVDAVEGSGSKTSAAPLVVGGA